VSELTYQVPGMSCGHCKAAVEAELGAVAGVETVDVDLEAKRVVVHGHGLEDARLRAAIEEAGYQAV
jgi:copper ion binding protein